MKLVDIIKLDEIKELRLLNFPVIRISYNSNKIEAVNLFPFKSLNRIIEKRYFKELKNKDFDDIYVIWNNTGETWQFLTFAQNYIKQKGSKKPILVAEKAYHKDLIKMLMPNVPYIQIQGVIPKHRIYIEKYIKKLYNHNYELVLPLTHFFKLEDNLQNNKDVHYFDELLKTLNTDTENIVLTEPQISQEAFTSMEEKIRPLNLNLEKFVFISPEAKSNNTQSDKFWQVLIEKLNILGYDCYFNIAGSLNTIGLKNIKKTDLTIEEACALAKKAKAIIGLRSGFMEILNSVCSSPIFCFYTHFRKRVTPELSADKVLKGFSLKKLPVFHKKEIFEYNADILNERELLINFFKDFEGVL